MTQLWLARHSETEWNMDKRMQGRGDSPLTAHGIALADALGRYVATCPPDVLLASPQGRAMHTARIVAQYVPLPIIEQPDLMEIALGALEGLRREQALDVYPEFVAFRDAPEAYVPLPSGETFAQLMTRAAHFLAAIAAQHPGQTVLGITHSMTLRAICAVVQGHPVHALWDEPHVDSCALFRFAWDEATGWRLQSAGDTSFLRGLSTCGETID